MIEIGLRQLEEDGIIIIRKEEIVLLEISPEDWGSSKDSNFQNAKKGTRIRMKARFIIDLLWISLNTEIQGVNGKCDEVAELNLFIDRLLNNQHWRMNTHFIKVSYIKI